MVRRPCSHKRSLSKNGSGWLGSTDACLIWFSARLTWDHVGSQHGPYAIFSSFISELSIQTKFIHADSCTLHHQTLVHSPAWPTTGLSFVSTGPLARAACWPLLPNTPHSKQAFAQRYPMQKMEFTLNFNHRCLTNIGLTSCSVIFLFLTLLAAKASCDERLNTIFIANPLTEIIIHETRNP